MRKTVFFFQMLHSKESKSIELLEATMTRNISTELSRMAIDQHKAFFDTGPDFRVEEDDDAISNRFSLEIRSSSIFLL